ncbi:GapR family DNA-binding domain-containing protein [Sinorhizobium psoraleae]|uniref:DUF2312 domain-containing protein n=1 Tax=Sinorhizobium psoraleae TaxID=520838 RepID=A0ABT4KBK9_9HYPH|nr:GapR family DNA-binding domain-containing protein [Sinorhizobium psoraleae]MCZ4089297.1 DUF2312 domain-containing protein [Sinorhizobium psoraleae]
MSSDGQLKAFIDRVLRLQEEQDALGQDIRDIHAEAKASGFDKTVKPGDVVAYLRKTFDKKGRDAIENRGAIFSENVSRRLRAALARCMHVEEQHLRRREAGRDGRSRRPVRVGRKALIATVDIMIAREEAEETLKALDQR